jgi:hypothetical protein
VSKHRKLRRWCLRIGSKSVWKRRKSQRSPLCHGKTEGGAKKGGKKDLQICEAGRKSRKRPTLVVGQKPNGESQSRSLDKRSIFAANRSRSLGRDSSRSGRKPCAIPAGGFSKWPQWRSRKGGLEKLTCKSAEREENQQNHEKGPCGSWARNQMPNRDPKRT